MSFSADQVRWLAAVLTMLQRGGDVRVLMQNTSAHSTLALILRAKERIGKEDPPKRKYRAPQCRAGHDFNEENTYTNKADGRRKCRVCSRLHWKRYRKMKHDQACQVLLEALAEQRTGS